MRRALAAVGVLAALCLAGLGLGAAVAIAPAVAAKPAPTGIPLLQPVRDVDPLQGALHLGLRKDRLLKSVVPGPVSNTEQLTVGVGPTGAPAPLASSLDRLYDAARAPKAAVPPYAGSGLPTTVPGAHQGDEQLNVTAPLRVTGSIGVAETGAAVRGAGATPSATGAAIAGTLDGSTSWDIDVRSGPHPKLDLDVRPWLDPRLLVPPTGSSWRSWAATDPTAAERQSATTTLAEAAASAARAAEYSPYLH